MIINCPEANESKSQEKPIHYLLYKAIVAQTLAEPFKSCLNNETQVFEFGAVTKSVEKQNENDSVIIKNYRFKDFSDKIKLRLSGEDFLVEDEKNQSVKNIGKLVHEILSEIETNNDIEKACMKAFFDGKIDKTELEEIRQTIKNNLELEEAKNWFNGSFTILNERNLLSPEKLLRPDRIMVSGNRAIVVDYKTGEKNPKKYNRQVEEYAQTLKNTGFEQVSGYLWYLSLNEVEKICTY